MNEKIMAVLAEATDSNGIVDQVKFAKMIIAECRNICEDMGDEGLDGHYAADEINRLFDLWRD